MRRRAELPDQVAELHRRASDWFEHNGMPSEAIRQALSAQDRERAADPLERGGGRTNGQRDRVLVLQAIAHHPHGRMPAASQALERALALAAPDPGRV